jgi:TctA family transporter
VIGYLFLRLRLEAAPLMLGFILGPMLEEYFRRALLLSRGSFTTFFTHPVSGTIFIFIGIVLFYHLAVAFACLRRSKSTLLPIASFMGFRKDNERW